MVVALRLLPAKRIADTLTEMSEERQEKREEDAL